MGLTPKNLNTMEFREYYRGICAKIRFDYVTDTYLGELVGVPAAASVQATSYEDLRASLMQAVEEHLSGRSNHEWTHLVHLEQVRAEREAEKLRQESAQTAAEPKKQTEKPEIDPFEHRLFLR